MKRNLIFLILSVVVFCGWIAWLGTQALRHKNPVVVSRSQLLISQCDVVARVDDLQKKRVTVEEVLYTQDGGPAKGAAIEVKNLTDAKGFSSPGSYVLPLINQKQKGGEDTYILAGLPDDPGFPYDGVDPRSVSPRVYPYSDEVRRQLAEIHEKKGK